MTTEKSTLQLFVPQNVPESTLTYLGIYINSIGNATREGSYSIHRNSNV